MLSLDQFNFFWVPSSLGCCFIFFITWITGTIPHFYSLLPSWSLSLFYIFIIFDILGNATRCRDDDDDKIYIYDLKRRVISCLLHTKGRRRKGKEMNSKSKMTSICTLTDQYIVSCFYISLRERLDFSLSIYHGTRFFFRPPCSYSCRVFVRPG